jgi:hypothetical protein
MIIGLMVAKKVLGQLLTSSNKKAKIKSKNNHKRRRKNHQKPRKKQNKKTKSQK